MRYNIHLGGSGIRNIITMTLGDIVEAKTYHLEGSVSEKIKLAVPMIFNFEYERIDEEFNKHLEELFLREYFFSEIGFETEGQFLFRLETWMKLNMPYYNKLLRSQVWEDAIKNPLHNYELTDTTTITEQTTEEETNTSATTINKNQKTTGSENTTEELNGTSSASDNGSSSNTETTNVTSEKNKEDSINTVENVEGSNTTDSEVESFDRKLTSDTPQSRLAITTEDGKGIIEYASTIAEDTSKVSTATSQSNEAESNSNTESDTKETLEETHTKVGSSTNSNLNSSNSHQDKTQNSTNENNLQEDETLDSTGNKQNNGTTQREEKREATGSIGVKTYGELLNDYRDIFQNYERIILDAIHSELFMLVY